MNIDDGLRSFFVSLMYVIDTTGMATSQKFLVRHIKYKF